MAIAATFISSLKLRELAVFAPIPNQKAKYQILLYARFRLNPLQLATALLILLKLE